MKKTASFLLALVMLVSGAASAYAGTDLEEAIKNTAEYIYETTPGPSVASIGGEWAVLGLARSGAEVPDSYFEKYYENAVSYVKSCGGVLHDRKYTEYSRVILAMSAIGQNPENVGGYNLLVPLGDYEKTVWQGINGPIWALIALDSGGYEIPKNNIAERQATREMYLEKILSSQGGDGGWSLTGSGASDVDITAMALCALAPYRGKDGTEKAVDGALEFLSAAQNENGGFSSWGSENSESASQVITALCALGIPMTDARFVKNGHTVFDNLMTFYNKDTGFEHTYDGSGSNRMSAEQGLYALAALKRFSENKTRLYDMSDVEKKNTNAEPASAGLAEKNAAVKKMPVVSQKSFSDIADSYAKIQIEALASRGIINGVSDELFMPDSTMTRAEFATIVTRALGIGQTAENCFSDISENDWFCGYVAAAHEYGIVSGVSETEFAPGGIISKEEAAVMVRRAAKLCGMTKTYDGAAVRDVLAAFSDYTKTSAWAREALAFCYDGKILSDAESEIMPKTAVTRAEIAVMLYNMLGAAKLL